MESLPDNALSRISSYLTKTARAIFATALSAPAPSSSSAATGGADENEEVTSISNARTAAILSNPYYRKPDRNDYGEKKWVAVKYDEFWEILTFLDIEESLRAKLTDNDLHGILSASMP